MSLLWGNPYVYPRPWPQVPGIGTLALGPWPQNLGLGTLASESWTRDPGLGTRVLGPWPLASWPLDPGLLAS